MSKVGANVELPPWMIEMEDRVTVSVRNSRSFTCKELLLVHSHHIVELVIVQEPCTKHPLQEMISINRDFLYNNSFRHIMAAAELLSSHNANANANVGRK